MTDQSATFQIRLFDLIEQRHPLGKKWLLEYMEITGLKKSAAYHRRKGEASMTADEALSLMKHYRISWQDLFSHETSAEVLMHFPTLLRKPASPIEFVENLQNQLRRIIQAQTNRIYYAAAEFPVFYYFSSPLMAAFKFYFWSYMAWGNIRPDKVQFDRQWIDQKEVQNAINLGKDVLKTYRELPVTEFWSAGMLLVTLQQIKQISQETDTFDRELLDELLQELKNMVGFLKNLAQPDEKNIHEIRANLSVYVNNVSLAITPQGNKVYFVWDNPNILYSEDRGLGQYVETWFLQLRQQSEHINGPVERPRRFFFKQLEEELDWRIGRMFA